MGGNNQKKRRMVLKAIGVGALFGASTTGAASAKPTRSAKKGVGSNRSAKPKTPAKPEPSMPSRIEDLDPYNPNQVVALGQQYRKWNKQQRRKAEEKLTSEQKEAVADSFKPAHMTVVEYKSNKDIGGGKFDPISDEKANVLSTDSKTIREDIGQKWGWTK